MKRLFARWVFGRAPGTRAPMLSWPLALMLVLALLAGSVLVLNNLRFNNSPEVYYPADARAVLLRDELRRDFPGDEVLTVIFQGDDLYEADFLQRLTRLTEILSRSPEVDRVTTVTTMERITGSEDGFAVEKLLPPQMLRNDTPAQLQERVMSDRFAPGTIASRDLRHIAMVVRPQALTESSQRLALALTVARAINEVGLREHYAGEAGPVTMDVLQLESLFNDTKRFLPITAAAALGLLAWVVGRWRPVVIGSLAMVTVVLPTLAVLGLSGRPYTMASAILPNLLTAYTVVTLLHLYAGIQRAQRRFSADESARANVDSAANNAKAIDSAICETIKPGLFNVLTTGAGLLSLTWVPIPPVQVFGVIGALGTLVVFITVYALMPPLLRRFAGPAWPQRGSGLGVLGRVAKRITHASMRYPKVVLGVCAALVLAAAPAVLKVQVETDMLAFFAPDHRINVHTRLIEEKLMGVTSLEISLQASERDAFQSVALLRELKAFQQWLDAQPEVDRSVSMVDLTEEMHWAMNGERPEFRSLPPSDRLLSQYLLVYDGVDLYELVNRDFQHARVMVNLNVNGTQAIREVIDRIQAQLQAQPLTGVKADVGGYGRLLADQLELLVDGQIKSFGVAFAQIFLIMALLWRSPKGAAVCMLPNLAPLFFIFVLMGALAVKLDSATVMIASVVLGITVDDTIHLFHGFRSRLRQGMTPVFAIARSFDATGRAVMATSAILVAQFLLLALSDFVPTANFGLMTATGLVAGLAFELVLLPALLVLAYGGKNRKSVGKLDGASVEESAEKAGSKLVSRAFPATVTPDAGQSLASETLESQRPGGLPKTIYVRVCKGERCRKQGALAVWKRLRAAQENEGLQARVSSVRCLGPCEHGPVIEVAQRSRTSLIYGPMKKPALELVITEHLLNGDIVESFVQKR